MITQQRYRRLRQWLRLLAATCALCIAVVILATGITPPGRAGDVLRHNRANDIDATPLLYSEVEHMAELERGVQEMRDSAAAHARVIDNLEPTE